MRHAAGLPRRGTLCFSHMSADFILFNSFLVDLHAHHFRCRPRAPLGSMFSRCKAGAPCCKELPTTWLDLMLSNQTLLWQHGLSSLHTEPRSRWFSCPAAQRITAPWRCAVLLSCAVICRLQSRPKLMTPGRLATARSCGCSSQAAHTHVP